MGGKDPVTLTVKPGSYGKLATGVVFMSIGAGVGLIGLILLPFAAVPDLGGYGAAGGGMLVGGIVFFAIGLAVHSQGATHVTTDDNRKLARPSKRPVIQLTPGGFVF